MLLTVILGGSKNSWQPVMGADTTTSSYWLNWRVLLCCLWILTAMGLSSYLITKYERPLNQKSRNERRDYDGNDNDDDGVLYDDEIWKPCLKGIHPAWLMTYRIFAFFVLLILIILNAIVDGGSIFYYYTQWTFTLITIYFGIGSLLSINGCCKHSNKVGGDRSDEQDEEQAAGGEITNLPNAAKYMGTNKDCMHPRQVAGFWGYIFQIMFQMQAGAVVLTDCVFWFIILPFLAIKDYNLNFFIINMHSINAIFLLGETALNSLRFPWFRIAYFVLWTCVFVVFQWIVHACIALWWPYPFLDLKSSFSPLWYLAVALLHIPCYGLFVLVIKLKHFVLLKWFPDSTRYIL